MQNLNYNLVQTSTIILELECLFGNGPKLCLKQNASGWGTNQRIVFVKDKKLYYAKVIDGFKDDSILQIPQKNIKAFVNLEDIYEVNYLPVEREQKRTVSILIPQKRINQQGPLDPINPNLPSSSQQPNALSRPQKKEEEKIKFIRWIFHFQYDLKQKLQQIKQQMKQKLRRKNQLNINQDLIGTMNFANNLEMHTPEKEQMPQTKTVQEQQIPLGEYVNQIRKAKDFLKFKQNRQKLQKQQRRKNKPRESIYQQQTKTFNSQEQNYPIMTHWRQYFGALQQLQQMRNQQKTVYEYELVVYKEIHNFRETCINIFKNYIMEKLNNTNGEKWKFEEFYFYKGIWIKLGGKQLNQQFMMYYYISDLTNILNKSYRIPYRVPDVCLVDYLGFKALCMCDLPFSEIDKSEVYNLYNQTYDLQNMSKIKEYLSMLQKALNLKNEDFQKEIKKVAAPLGANLRIFEYQPKNDMKTDQQTLELCYYMTNLQNIFPLDFNYQLEELNLECRCRPEIIGDVRQLLQLDYDDNTQLLSTAFMVSSMNQEQKVREDDKVVKASKFIVKERIPEFAQKLNMCQLIIVDSYSLKMYMSEFGINMRYMYKIHELAKLKYIREVIQAQCLARTVKKIFKKALRDIGSEMFEQKRKQKNNNLMDDMDMDQEKNQNNQLATQQTYKKDEEKFNDQAIDFLNLIFGTGQEKTAFWKILIQHTEKQFKVKVAYPYQGSPGALLHAVLYNCGIQALFSIDIPLFQTAEPFSRTNQISLHPKIKTLQYPSFQIQKLIRSVPSIESIEHPNIELLQKIALKLYKMDLLKNYYLYDGELHYNLSFSKINVVKEQMQKPTHASSHHPSEISFFISNKTEVNFEKGMNLLNFCFSDFHPIYVSFYEEYSHSYQPQLLKKTAILQSIKCFGQFHSKTSQIYSFVYGQGYKEFYQKSLRSESVLSSNINMKGQFNCGKYYSCMQYCMRQMEFSKGNESRVKKENCIEYLEMLFMGMKAAQRIRYLKESLIISSSISDLLNKFKLRNSEYHFDLIHQILKIKMTLTPQKMFLYKLALLCISIQQKYNEKMKKDKNGWMLPAEGKQKETLSLGIMNEYFSHDTHSLWLENIFRHLLSSFQYFNHLEDLFNNFEYHLQRYDNSFFKESLGYWDVLIRLYGQQMFRDYLYQTGNA